VENERSADGNRDQRGDGPGEALAAARATGGCGGNSDGATLADPSENRADVGRALPAAIGVLRETGPDDPVERRRRHRNG
jgi:hypothetical protein